MHLIKGGSAAAALALLLSARPPAIPQSPQATDPKTGVIAGRVLDGISKSPIDDAVVTISGPDGYQRRVMVEENGRFAVGALAAGRYRVRVDRFGYAPGEPGRTDPSESGRAIEVTAAQQLAGIEIALWKYAALSGRVVDDAGEPVVRVNVRAWRPSFSRGGQGLVAPTGISSASTDDRGIYRIGSLEPGTYTVAIATPVTTLPRSMVDEAYSGGPSADTAKVVLFGATPELSAPTQPLLHVGDFILSMRSTMPHPPGQTFDGRITTYRATFFGGDAAHAEFVTVGPGEDRRDINLHLRASAGSRVAGRITTPAGPLAGASIRLTEPAVASRTDDRDFAVATTVTDGEGRFTFLAVPPGEYLLERNQTVPVTGTPEGAQPTYWIEERVVHGVADTLQLALTARALPRIQGRIVMPANLPGTPVVIVHGVGPNRGRVINPRLDKAQRFSTELVPGAYTIGAAISPSVSCNTIVGERDISDGPVDIRDDFPIEIVIRCGDLAARIAGTVRDARGAPVTGRVMAFPVDTRFWAGATVRPRRIAIASVEAGGEYVIGNLPSGDYWIAAVPNRDAVNWPDPALLGRLAAVAQRVKLGAEVRRIDLTLATISR